MTDLTLLPSLDRTFPGMLADGRSPLLAFVRRRSAHVGGMGAELKPVIYLDTVGQAIGRHINLNLGGLPYLWIGDASTCYGCVPDDQVRALRDMCNEILYRRESPPKKRTTRK